MRRLAERLAEAFVAPAGEKPTRAQAPPAAGPSVAVLCRSEQRWLAGATAAAAAGGRGAPLVAVWTGDAPALPPVALPATPAARRTATRLAARGHAARTSGRLVRLALPADPAAAAAEAARARAAADGAVVVVLAGARDERLDWLVAAQDRVLVARDARDADTDTTSVAELALRQLALDGHRADELVLPASATARALAAGGVVLPWR